MDSCGDYLYKSYAVVVSQMHDHYRRTYTSLELINL